ncbi:MAG TPA: hypothetical protein PKO36_07835 [Candidatus Hydrogenedentes bacterium]|nr:hypothetical protein [Candidatus Hydrogenedentota bacterium]HOV76117.1 hypothetical protein [Candidatus Hydrogenedentota bacterium]HPC18391.1 hypothetical protein [Candidatus Hydrogenedentota bacterium]HRT22148.1 hypothetical protein [Candidatus Hydrogenedentota bacterium]HRT66877.1 hypothetical protein [Candidatus Hydrogenedentota bacterium]
MNGFRLFAIGCALLASVTFLTGCPAKPLLTTDAASHHFAADETEWTFQVWNGGSADTVLTFTIGADKPWVTVTPFGQSAGADQKVTVTVAIDRLGAAKAAPEFTSANLTISSNGGDATIPITTAPDYFTQNFTAGIPLSERSLTFTPDGSLSFFKATNDPATAFPTNPAGGIDLAPLFAQTDPVPFTPYRNIPFYGVLYDRFYVGSSGTISFGAAHAPDGSLAGHFAAPQITALSTLNAAGGGSVKVKQTPTRVAVTYENVPSADKKAGGNNVQIELFFDGTIRMTYLNVDAPSGIVGLSYGPGNTDDQGNPIAPSDFIPSDFTSYNTSGMKAAN